MGWRWGAGQEIKKLNSAEGINEINMHNLKVKLAK